jgi:hypothetical protein
VFIILPYSGYRILFLLERVFFKPWTLPAFSELSNMSRDTLVHLIAAAATTQVKLCPYDEKEPHIWFRIIKPQFAAAGIKSQKLKYANALVNLPKQVLQDILDTLHVCNDSDDPFDCLKDALLGQFGKSKWQTYFEFFASLWKCRASSPAFSWGSSNSTCLQEFIQTQICFYPCSSFACRLPCEKR